MRIIFFGTPSFAIPSLQTLLDSGEEVVAVVTQPDKPKGRTKAVTPPPVKELALARGIPVLQPRSIRTDSFLDELIELKPDMIVVVAYGKILPPRVLSLPPKGCINVHASLLPKYRGAAPIQWAIIKGEDKTGVTTMYMDEGLDTGDMLLREETEITADDNAETLAARLAHMGGNLLLKTVRGLKEGSIVPVPQRGNPSFAPPLTKEDGKINWFHTSKEISDFVRGMHPWPGAFCYLMKERIRIIKVTPAEGQGIPGKIERSDEYLTVGTGEGLLHIIELQPEGRRKMTSREFLAGRRIGKGIFLDGT